MNQNEKRTLSNVVTSPLFDFYYNYSVFLTFCFWCILTVREEVLSNFDQYSIFRDDLKTNLFSLKKKEKKRNNHFLIKAVTAIIITNGHDRYWLFISAIY